MPYIKQTHRDTLDPLIKPLADQLLAMEDTGLEGNLNYTVTTLLHTLLDGKTNYKRINGLIGALECTKLELYRKLAAPYEDVKELENGKVTSL